MVAFWICGFWRKIVSFLILYKTRKGRREKTVTWNLIGFWGKEAEWIVVLPEPLRQPSLGLISWFLRSRMTNWADFHLLLTYFPLSDRTNHTTFRPIASFPTPVISNPLSRIVMEYTYIGGLVGFLSCSTGSTLHFGRVPGVRLSDMRNGTVHYPHFLMGRLLSETEKSAYFNCMQRCRWQTQL